jgi:hypothetical protein
MKKLIVTMFSIAAMTYGYAQQSRLDIVTVKKIEITEAVTSLKVYQYVEVILTNDSTPGIKIVGENCDVENINFKINRGELSIIGTPESMEETVTVYVSAKHLNRIFIHGGSTVRSAGLMKNEQLDVTINGPGTSCIRTMGLISQNTIADIPWNFSL